LKIRHFPVFVLFFGQICSAQIDSVSGDSPSHSIEGEGSSLVETGNQSAKTANSLSEDCQRLVKGISLKRISFDRFIGYPGSRGLWLSPGDECGATVAADFIQEYERLNPQLTREKRGWVRLTTAKALLYGGQRDKALQAFDRALIRPAPTLENSEVPAAFHMGSAWNHFVQAYIALTKKDKEALLAVREQLSKGEKVFGEVPYLREVDSLIDNFDSY
jgi:hypothetical protein